MAKDQGAVDWAAMQAPSLDDIEAIARDGLAGLPEAFRRRLGETAIRVTEFPDEEVVREMELESDFDILGLFQGVGMAHDAAVAYTGRMPNQIWLYRRPILDYWAEHEETLASVVTHVLIHEIGHHFGLSDDDIDAIEAAAG